MSLPTTVTAAGAGTAEDNGIWTLAGSNDANGNPYYTRGSKYIFWLSAGGGQWYMGPSLDDGETLSLDYTSAEGVAVTTFPKTGWTTQDLGTDPPPAFVDVTPPAFASAAVNSAGTAVTVNLTETDSPPILPPTGVTGFTLRVAGSVNPITAAIASSTAVTLTVANTIYAGELVTVAYTPGNVTDSAGAPNSMLAFDEEPVTNNSATATPATASSHKLVFSTGSLVANWVDGDGDAQTATFAILQDISLDITFNRAYLYDAAQNSIFPVDHADSMGHAQLKASNATISADTLQRLVAATLAGTLGEGTVTATLPKQLALPAFQCVFTGQAIDGKSIVATFESAKAKGRSLALKLSDFAVQDFTLDCYPGDEDVVGTIAFTN